MLHRTCLLATVTVLLAAFVAVPVQAAVTNLGPDLPLPTTPHDLSVPDGSDRILYAPSEADDPGLRAAIAAITGGTVDYFDATSGTPTLDLLLTYDCVHVWANYAFADNILFGDRLADFVDAGGSVVLGVFCTYTSGNSLAGRIMTADYCPVVSPTGSNHFLDSNYAGDGVTCIHEGVVSYGCYFRDVLALQGAGIVDGHYLDQEIGHAYRPDFKVIYSNGSGSIALGGLGDWALLIANACACDGGGTPTQNTTWGTIKSQYR